MTPSTAPVSAKAPSGSGLDVEVLLSALDKALPARKSGLLTPFIETVLLMERLRVAGFDIRVQRRCYYKESKEYAVAQAIELDGVLFNARSKDPWEDVAQWNYARTGIRTKYLAVDPLSDEEVADAMRNAEFAYRGYRDGVDRAIAQARAAGEGTLLEENTAQTAGQAALIRL